MKGLHPLLMRQLRNVGGSPASASLEPRALRELLEAVNRAYLEADWDRSAHAKREQELREARQEIDAARRRDRAKSDFLAGTSHEIRTPMAGVVGMADVLLETDLDPEQRDYAETLRDSATALLGILNDILDFSRIEAGMLEVDSIRFDLRTAVEEVAALLAPLAEEKNIELVVRFDPTAPRYLIGDPGRIRQVLTNLVGNSIKFTREGHVLVDVSCPRLQGTEALLRFAVEDTGIGIAREKLRRIFERFTQGDPALAREFGGTGLGLAISSQLVELMGGEIGVTSELGVGSTFTFELPLGVDSEAPPARRAEDLGDVRIMVVDASEAGQRSLEEQLVHWEMRCECFASGAEALRRLRQAVADGDPFRILVLSTRLNGMDAEALGDLVKSDPVLRETDIVLLASVGEKGAGKRLTELGFAAYLVKPIREAPLKEALEFVWGARKHGVPQGLVTRHTLTDSGILELTPAAREAIAKHP